MMFKCGDAVMYGASGICKITEMIQKEYMGSLQVCFVLTPVFGKGMKIFVPLENEDLLSKMRYALTKSEISDIISSLPAERAEYIDIDAVRSAEYNKILSSGNQVKIASVIRTLLDKKDDQIRNKKKLHQCDEAILKKAQKLFNDEVAFVLGLDPSEVENYIENQKH